MRVDAETDAMAESLSKKTCSNEETGAVARADIAEAMPSRSAQSRHRRKAIASFIVAALCVAIRVWLETSLDNPQPPASAGTVAYVFAPLLLLTIVSAVVAGVIFTIAWVVSLLLARAK